jgi:hypothetical protein
MSLPALTFATILCVKFSCSCLHYIPGTKVILMWKYNREQLNILN